MRKRIDTKGNIMMEREAHDDIIATLEQENRQLHARNQRLQAELDAKLTTPKLTDELIGDLWHQSGCHLHKFARLLIKWADDNAG